MEKIKFFIRIFVYSAKRNPSFFLPPAIQQLITDVFFASALEGAPIYSHLYLLRILFPLHP